MIFVKNKKNDNDVKRFNFISFKFIVLLPTLLACFFYIFIASPIYVSTASLKVYKANHSPPSLVSMLSGSSGGGSTNAGRVLKKYILSWTEYQEANQKINLAAAWSKGDFIFRYGGLMDLFRRNDVALWHYYQNHVRVSVSENSGIVSIRVLGPSSAFASRLGNQILKDSIAHIDQMNHQEEQDYMARALRQKHEVQSQLNHDEAALSQYRAKIGIYDPKLLYASQLTFLEALKEQKAKLEAQYDTMANATPNNPVNRNMRAAIKVITTKIENAQKSFSKLSRDAAGYDPLVTARTNDTFMLRQVEIAVQEAELKADKNKYYLAIISPMSNPHAAELPDRLFNTFAVFLLTFILWVFVR